VSTTKTKRRNEKGIALRGTRQERDHMTSGRARHTESESGTQKERERERDEMGADYSFGG
jgi:hypothetical protein